uniref:Uncharacterized protein n=1 Tax=Podoviridae sp. ctgFL11 TaxID=2827744 RepID=A0A8S5SY41_9CAUD|nr:MAG TPA: hypothetical protein [Podoviridae sp. ctgFL11]
MMKIGNGRNNWRKPNYREIIVNCPLSIFN